MNPGQPPEFTNSNAYAPHTYPLLPALPYSNAYSFPLDDHALTPQSGHSWDTTTVPRSAHHTLDTDQSLAGPLHRFRSTHHAATVGPTGLFDGIVGDSICSTLETATIGSRLPAAIYSSTEAIGLPQRASPIIEAGVTSLSGHPATQHWQERSIDSQPISQSANATREKRPYRCFSCRQHPSKSKCFNYPICDRCTARHSECESDEHLQQDQFLDWRYLLSVCQKLNKTSQISQTASNPTFSDPVILEFTHHDRMLQNQWEAFIVVFSPELQALSDSIDATETDHNLRAPAFYKEHLDALIRGGVWGQFIWNSDGTGFSAGEIKLWDSVRLFIGYHSLLYNLATTFVEATESATTSILARVIAELVYAIGFYLQFHYYEIVSTVSGERPSAGENKISPAVRLYSLEVLLRCTTSMRKIDWGVSVQSAPHPLISLERYFNTQIEHILCQFNQLECRASGESHKNRHMRPPPAMVEFAKSLPASSFPKHCIIKVYRHRCDVPPMASSVQGVGEKHRGIDILTLQDDDVLASSRNNQTSPPWYEFDHVVTHNNKIISIWEVVMASLTRLEGSGNDINDQQSDTRQADSNASELALRLLALQQDVGVEVCLSESSSLIGNEMTGIESPSPSLVSGTPLSMLSVSSPATPASSVTIGPYWAWMNSFS